MKTLSIFGILASLFVCWIAVILLISDISLDKSAGILLLIAGIYQLAFSIVSIVKIIKN